ncbi:MAG: transcription elongation factor GreA [Magnetococcales bacterium]|nr:transcription elongation factor GreA [Magnetococcales bacterium]
MSDKVPMTLAGAEQLKADLHRLKTVERRRIVAAISSARELGDLSENAEYHAAKEEQSFNEGKIQEYETKLANAQIIDTARLKSDKVIFGAKVTVLVEETEQEATYQIVGVDEADLSKGKISITSPMARGLIGKCVGDSVEVQAPGGARHFEILEITF